MNMLILLVDKLGIANILGDVAEKLDKEIGLICAFK